MAAAGLRSELLRWFEAGADAPIPEAEFDELALRVFAHNVETVPAYGAYCAARDRTPATVEHWTQVPAVPTTAFKELPLHDRTAAVERVFRTSGTSRGRERRGEHHVVDLDLYRASLRATFEAFLLPDGARPRMLSLMPSVEAMPDSSLAFMISDVMTAFGGEGAATVADPDGIDYAALDARVGEAGGEPVLLLGTSAAFVHWLDHLAEDDRRVALSEGSRLMDTGGYKGRGRRFDPDELRAAYGERLGLPAWACVNEYGMTELLSQYYDTSLRDRTAASPPRKRGPGWLRSVAVDPETLDPLPPGHSGVLRHVDLANLHSVAAVQTEDLGAVDGRGLVLEGRAAGAPPRGCSIAMDMLLDGAP